jgi:uncharacterized cupin superfamily protein
VITTWHELESWRADWGHLGATWQDLVGAACDRVGVKRIAIEPGRWSTPLHVEQAEEIFFVLRGGGISLQQEDRQEPSAFEVRAGDCLVHRANAEAHTLRAGDDGLDVIAFGERRLGGSAYLPRAGVAWLGDTWVLAGDPQSRPWKRDVEAGEPEVPEVCRRPGRIVNVADVEPTVWEHTSVRCTWRDLARAAGSVRTGLRHVVVEPGAYMAPPHAHGAEDEVFVVLEGAGTLELWPGPRYGGEREDHPVAAGSTVTRPAGTHVAHGIRAGDSGLTVLAYGTRVPNDVSYYPRSRKVNLRGIGVIGRIEQLDYWDGED